MREVAERASFLVSLTLGRLLRGARYSKVRIVYQDGERQVQKHRSFYAPVLVSLGDPLVRLLAAGVRVLPQREWLERERLIYRSLYATSIQVFGDGVLLLPCLPGETLATLLEDPRLDESKRSRAIELAVAALAQLHRAGFTHGDAMAENVMVDFAAGVARWFDFETVHDANRPSAWRRADDVRALLATTLLRTRRDAYGRMLQLILDVYANDDVTRLLATSFDSALQRPLAFHLGQAPLSFDDYREIAVLLRERFGAPDGRCPARR